MIIEWDDINKYTQRDDTYKFIHNSDDALSDLINRQRFLSRIPVRIKVDTVPELTAISENIIGDGQMILVESTGILYYYDATAVAGDYQPDNDTDGIGWWIEVANGGGGGGSTDFIITKTAGENIPSERVVVSIANQIFLFDPTDINHYGRVIGISSSTATTGNPVDVQTGGIITLSTVITTGLQYFGDSNGFLSLLSASDMFQPVGVALANNKLLIEVQQPIIKVVSTTDKYVAVDDEKLTEKASINFSNGNSDAGKIVSLNNQGKIDPSMLDSSINEADVYAIVVAMTC